MKAVIMAGGEGTRLRPLTSVRPKPMTTLLGKPIIAYTAELLRAHGTTDAVLTLGYMSAQLEEYFSEHDFGMSISFSREDSPLGTAGGVKKAAAGFCETFAVLSGDALTDADLSAALAFHRKSGAKLTILLKRVENPLEYGIVVTEQDGRVKRFCEKPAWGEVFSDLVNTGIYIIEPEILELIPDDTPFDFSRQLFPALLERGIPVYGFATDGYWCDIGTTSCYITAQEDILAGRVVAKIDGECRNGVWIGSDAAISPSAAIEAPAFIGAGCSVAAGAFIGAFSALGDGCVVAGGARIKRGMLAKNVYIGRGSRVSRAIICDGAAIGSDCRLLEGAVVGDGCVVSDGAVICAGAKLWPGKWIDGGAVIDKNLIWGGERVADTVTASGVCGRLGADISIGELTRLGSALATVGARQLLAGCDGAALSRAALAAVCAGAAASGAVVTIFKEALPPLLAAATLELHADGAIYIKRLDGDAFIAELAGADGLPLAREQRKKLNGAIASGAFNRTPADAIRPFIIQKSAFSLYRRHLCGSSAGAALAGLQMCAAVTNTETRAGAWLAAALKSAGVRIDAHARIAFTPDADGRLGSIAADGAALSDSAAETLRYALAFGEMARLGETKALVPAGTSGRIRTLGRELGIDAVEENTACPRGSAALSAVFSDMAYMAALLLARLSEEPDYALRYGGASTVYMEVACERKRMGALLRELSERFGESSCGCGVRVSKKNGFGFICPSDTEPVIRIKTEGYNEEYATELCGLCADEIKKILTKIKK